MSEVKHCEGCRCDEIARVGKMNEEAIIVRRKLERGEYFTDKELRYAAFSRCGCGAGMAYPKGAPPNHYWDCSDILTGRADPRRPVQHSARLSFAFYEIKSEDQPSANGATTRRQAVRK
jgi:hypothetical protein